MTCLPEGTLRAYLDDALPATEREAAQQHLEQCAACREYLTQLQQRAAVVRAHLQSVAPVQETRSAQALARWRAQIAEQDEARVPILGRWMMGNNRNRVWRPVLSGVVVLALLVGVFSFAPSRALARQLLGIFRVRKFAVIQINPDQARIEEVGKALQDKLFSREPEIIADEPAVPVASIAEAKQKAGFDVRMPSYMPAPNEPISITVKGRTEFAFHFTRDALVTVLELAQMDSKQIPAGFTEGTLHATAPAMVNIEQGQIAIIQVNDPSMDYPEGINPALVGEAGLRLMGLAPDEAKRIASQIDWANTMLLPIPTSIAEFREVQVAGVQAVLLTERPAPDAHRRAVSALLWQKGNVVYMVGGPISSEQLVQVANSMF
jgi:hypothetical protein